MLDLGHELSGKRLCFPRDRRNRTGTVLGKHRRFPLCSYQAAKMAMFGRAEHAGGPAIPLFNKVVMF